ncbi:MAG: serine/threonine protein kinase [Polyangiales bacterium]|jgi:serine/threonine protein kinase
MSALPPQRARAAGPALAPGTVVGGRFAIERQEYADHLGIVLRSKDTKTEKAIALRLLAPGLVDAAGMKVLRAECRTAASLSHKNIVTTYGVGTASGRAFVATAWVEGRPLTDVIAARRKNGGHMSLGGIYRTLEHVCRALTIAQPKACHGTLRPSAVWIADDGRVQVTDFGLARALLAGRGAAVFAKEDQSCFAPEVKAGSPPTAAADIFGLGAILYLLLTGKSPADGFVPPSQVHPDATSEIDQVLLMCLAADPAARFASPDEVRAALMPLVADAPTVSLEIDLGVKEVVLSVAPAAMSAAESSEGDDPSDIDVDIDIDVGSIQSPATPQAMASIDPFAPAPRVPSGPQAGDRVSIHEEFRASIPNPPPPTTNELGNALKQLTANDAPRWMVDKDGLSHGPFDARELVELIVKGEVLEQHVLSNMDTGAKKPIKQWPEFKEFVEQQKLRQRQKVRKTALDDAEKSEKRSGATKLIVGGLLIGGLVTAAVVFFATRETGDDETVADAELGELFEHGEIEIEGTAGILPDPPRRGGGMRRSGMGMGGGGGFAGSYEDAMNRAVELGDATMGGGQGRLSPAQVVGVMNRQVNRIYSSCVGPEAARGGRLGNVTIDIAIAGSGSVQGVSARQGSGAFKACVQRAVRRVRFPSFGAPRMGARYSFDASP